MNRNMTFSNFFPSQVHYKKNNTNKKQQQQPHFVIQFQNQIKKMTFIKRIKSFDKSVSQQKEQHSFLKSFHKSVLQQKEQHKEKEQRFFHFSFYFISKNLFYDIQLDTQTRP